MGCIRGPSSSHSICKDLSTVLENPPSIPIQNTDEDRSKLQRARSARGGKTSQCINAEEEADKLKQQCKQQ